jgi:hypothetical protein
LGWPGGVRGLSQGADHREPLYAPVAPLGVEHYAHAARTSVGCGERNGYVESIRSCDLFVGFRTGAVCSVACAAQRVRIVWSRCRCMCSRLFQPRGTCGLPAFGRTTLTLTATTGCRGRGYWLPYPVITGPRLVGQEQEQQQAAKEQADAARQQQLEQQHRQQTQQLYQQHQQQH